MGTNRTAEERVKFTLKMRDTLRQYLDMEGWTPVMGAMLLAGIRPEVGATSLPDGGGVTLDGAVIKGTANRPFNDARTILKEWGIRCKDDDHYPLEVSPAAFIAWFVEDEIQELHASMNQFIWADLFKSLAGYSPRSDFVDIDLVEHIAKTAEPLQTILEKLDSLASKASRHTPTNQAHSSLAPGLDKPIHAHRQHLTTKELAASLNVEPESIQKARSIHGHYCGVSPVKLPNRRLAWPIDSVEQISKGYTSQK